MGRPALFTQEDIIKTGVEISEKIGRRATPVDIHKALGGTGRLNRVHEIWRSYCNAATEEKTREKIELPDDLLERIGASVSAFEENIKDVIREFIHNSAEQQIRHFAAKEKEHANECSALKSRLNELVEENAGLFEHVNDLEQRLDELAPTQSR